MSKLRTLQSHGGGEGTLGTRIAELGPWFHNLHLPDGVQTAPDHPPVSYTHLTLPTKA